MVRGLARRGGPRRGGQIPEPRSAPPGPTDANEPTESAAWPVAGADPEPCPRPTDAGEPTDLPGWLARQGEVRSQPTKVPRAPQAEGKLAPGSRTCPVGENTFWGTTLAGAKTFPLTLATKNSKPAEPRPGTWKFFQTGPGSRNPGRPGTRGSLSQGAVGVAGRSRPPLTEDPETQAGRPLGRPGDLGVSPFPGDQPPVPPLGTERGEVGDRTPG